MAFECTWTRYSLEAAGGMKCLAEEKTIHSDVTARNCLLTDSDTLKITDFGLSVVDVLEVNFNQLKGVPTKYLAPETIDTGIFTTKTDVWSFGIFLWEIYIRCKQEPYEGKTNAETRSLVTTNYRYLTVSLFFINQDLRMPAPTEMPQSVAELLTACWNGDPEKGPAFKQIVEKFERGQPRHQITAQHQE